MTRQSRQKSSQRGTALMLALVLVIILGAGAAAAWKHMHVTMSNGQQVRFKETALQLAEGGLEKAIATLRVNPAYAGESRTALGEGFYTVEVSTTGDGRYHIASQGMLEDEGLVRARCGVEAELRLSGAGEVVALDWFERRRVEP